MSSEIVNADGKALRRANVELRALDRSGLEILAIG
jgi:hypothetical protein